MKKKLSYIFCVVWLLLMPATLLRAQAGDTLIFVYNENTYELQISRTGNNYFAFKPDQNDFSRGLNTIANNEYTDGKCKTLYNFGDYTHIANAESWWDSTNCAELNVFRYEGDKFFNEKIKYPVRVSVVHRPPQTQSVTEATEDTVASSNILMIIILLVIVLIGAGVVVFLFLRKKKKEQQEAEVTATELGLEIIEEDDVKLQTGLDYIRDNKDQYYVMDMQQDFVDTAVHKIYLHHTAIKKMYDFFKHYLESAEHTNETGCYFVGCWEYDDSAKTTYNVSIEDIVEPGDDIVPGEFSFNFGKKIGIKLYSLLTNLQQKTGRDYVHTLWMHSHPGLGLFLSSHDLLVQSQLTYPDAKNRLVAFVIDTNTPNWEMAVFTAKTSGSMNNKEDLKRLYSLDEIYQWSRKAHASFGSRNDATTEAVSVEKEENMENYHDVAIPATGRHFYVSGQVINAIDDALYELEGKQAAGGYLHGRRNAKGDYVIEECNKQKADDVLGLFVFDGKSTYEQIVAAYLMTTKSLCAIVYRSAEELWIVVRDSATKPFPTFAECPKTTWQELQNWLRRRRVYK